MPEQKMVTAKKKRKNLCLNCKHWIAPLSNTEEDHAKLVLYSGECRALPPVYDHFESNDEACHRRWPITKGSDFCSAHAPIPEGD